jgi:GNAT superfamily N-acetyltransferase
MTAEIQIEDRLAPFSEAFVADVVALARRVFDQVSPERMAWRMSNMPDLTCFLALAAGTPVGFKIGYALSEERYYSWLGGVDPDYRRRGIAAQLMIRQHAWAGERGYASVETRSEHTNIAMAQVNLAHGFTVSGTQAYPGRTQIIFSKGLDAGA